MPLPKPKLLAGWRRAKLIALINELYYTSAFAVVAPVGLWSTRLRCPQIHRLDLFVTRWPSTRDAQRNPNSEPKLRPPALSKSLTRSSPSGSAARWLIVPYDTFSGFELSRRPSCRGSVPNIRHNLRHLYA